MSNWKKGERYNYETTDGQYAINREDVPLYCAGPHPMRNGDYCEGEELHYSSRWVLIHLNGGGIEVYETLREAKQVS
jgi:hypothetical protein